MRPMTTQLHCAECNEMFEVSTEIADAMHRWREQSGEPFTCEKCAGVDAIYEQEKPIDPRPVGAVSNRTGTDKGIR